MPATLTSILGTDIISNSRATINTNYQALQTAKADVTSPSLLGVPTAPTAAYGTDTIQLATTQFVQQANSSVIGSGIIKNYVTKPTGYSTGALTQQFVDSTTTQYCGLFTLSSRMIVSSISVVAQTVNVAGTFKIVIYTEDGQTQKISITTASISVGSYTEYNTAVSPAVTLNPGNYYFTIVPVGTANVGFSSYTFSVIASNYPAGKAVLAGNASIVAATPAATLSPTALVFDAAGLIVANLLT